jgi:bacteriocin biosynthesis cyclodehydratase domain-containing protein
MTGAVPERPLLAPWYRLVGDGDRLLLEHGQSVVVLEGGAVRVLLPALLPILDGTRTLADLSARLGIAARPAIELALELLAAHGLLVEGPDAPRELRTAAHAVAAPYGMAPAVAAGRLAGATVAVVGASPAGVEIARLLHSAGIGDVRRLPWRGNGAVRNGAVDLAVVAPAADEGDALPGWNRLALDRKIRWLAVRPYDGRLASVGPLVVPGESCCHECLLLRRGANLEYGGDLADIEAAPVAASADAGIDAFAIALAAHLVVRWVGGRDTTVPGVLHAIETHPAFSLSEHHVLRVPRCGACSVAEQLAPRLPWHVAAAS